MSDLLSSNNCGDDGNDTNRAIFFLTKPPDSERTRLCFRLIEQSENAILYLAGDGVYNLLSSSIDLLPDHRIRSCREDLEARGVQSEDAAVLTDNFYSQLVKDMMLCGNRIFVF